MCSRDGKPADFISGSKLYNRSRRRVGWGRAGRKRVPEKKKKNTKKREARNLTDAESHPSDGYRSFLWSRRSFCLSPISSRLFSVSYYIIDRRCQHTESSFLLPLPRLLPISIVRRLTESKGTCGRDRGVHKRSFVLPCGGAERS